jgi:undecaprenyl diphosphate synthase
MELQHIAIIMDGNGRWAKRRGLSRAEGHRAGSRAAQRITRAGRRLGLPCLTLYALSTENLLRPAEELAALGKLLRHYLDTEVPSLIEHGIRLRVIGNRNLLAADLNRKIVAAEKQTAAGRDMTLGLALGYGGRDEIVRAAQALARRGRLRRVTEPSLASALDTAGLPDPDLLIRTGGERRLSNFLLWQSAYTELYFSRVLWPDFAARHLQAALRDYRQRERRFGRTDASLAPATGPVRPQGKFK